MKNNKPQTQKCASSFCKAQVPKEYGRANKRKLCKPCQQSSYIRW